MIRRIRTVVAAALVVGALAACAPGGEILPVDVPPGSGIGDDPVPAGVSAECLESYPGVADPGELADAEGIVPADWPAPPLGAELCVVLTPSDGLAILQYVSPKQDAFAVLDYYEVALQSLKYEGWEFVRDERVADQPTLVITGPERELAIQTDVGTATYAVGFEILSS